MGSLVSLNVEWGLADGLQGGCGSDAEYDQ